MKKPSTIAVHSQKNFKERFGSVSTPIFQSSAYIYPYNDEKLKYPRYTNLPNQEDVISRVAELESAEDGMLFSSGMGAISTTLLTVLKPGDHIIVQDQIYGGTYSFIEGGLKDLGIEYTYFNFSDGYNFSKTVKPNTKAIYLESPSNPLLKIVNIPEIAKLAKTKNITTMIDNTFASPINQNPIKLGVDIVMHSATKYLNGHSDLIAGVVISNSNFIKRLKKNARDLGCTTNELTAFLLSRGMKTLEIRVQRQNFNAQALAEFFEGHKKISKVYFPGLKSNPQHELAKGFMSGFGGMLSIEIDMNKDQINNTLKKLKYFTRAVSLGGVESLVCLPSETSHSYLPKEQREKLGIKDNLIRVSVGIENSEDLLLDWQEALS